MPGIPPTPDIFDAPGATICINSEWASFIEAQSGRLLSRSLWEGTDSEVDRAIDQIEQFLTRLADVGACALTPIGAMMMYPGGAVPGGWLTCDGAAISRIDYADLFAEIDTLWGPGDGATTFNIPDMRDKLPMGVLGSVVPDVGDSAGALTHTLSTGEIPAHSHGVTDPGHIHSITDPGHVHSLTVGAGGSGAVSQISNVNQASTTTRSTASNTTGISVQSHATGISTNNAGGGGSHSILNPVRGVHFMIFTGVL